MSTAGGAGAAATGDTARPLMHASAIGETATVTYTIYLPSVARQWSEPPSIFGVQMYAALHTPGAAVYLAQKAQVSWVRWPIAWSSIEPQDTTPDHFDWANTDASFLAAENAKLGLIATIQGNPAWAATYAAGPLDRAGLDPFVEFVGALVERYDGDGRDDAPGSPVVNYWEFYNEPDSGDSLRAGYGASYWGHYGAEYAQMLCAVYPVIKAASPNAKIVLGGLAYDWFEEDNGPFVRRFLDDVLAAGGGRCFDFMNFHYYPPFESVWAPYGPGLSGKTNYLRNKLASFGVGGLPMMVTEAGYHSNADSTWPSTPEIQSDFVIKLFTQAIASGIKSMIWFSWSDPPDYWAANGLLTMDLRPKPAYSTFLVARGKLGNASFQRRLSASELGSPDVQAYLFSAPAPLYVVWADGAGARQVRLPGKKAQIITSSGNVVAQVLDADDGLADSMLTATTTSTPMYVEVIE